MFVFWGDVNIISDMYCKVILEGMKSAKTC